LTDRRKTKRGPDRRKEPRTASWYRWRVKTLREVEK